MYVTSSRALRGNTGHFSERVGISCIEYLEFFFLFGAGVGSYFLCVCTRFTCISIGEISFINHNPTSPIDLLVQCISLHHYIFTTTEVYPCMLRLKMTCMNAYFIYILLQSSFSSVKL